MVCLSVHSQQLRESNSYPKERLYQLKFSFMIKTVDQMTEVEGLNLAWMSRSRRKLLHSPEGANSHDSAAVPPPQVEIDSQKSWTGRGVKASVGVLVQLATAGMAHGSVWSPSQLLGRAPLTFSIGVWNAQ